MAILDLLEQILATQPAILAAVALGLVGLVVAFYLASRGPRSENKKEESSEGEEEEKENGAEGTGEDEDASVAAKSRKQRKVKPAAKPKKTTLPSHPLLAADLKGHTGAVLSLDFNNTAPYLASCSEDRTLRLWHMKSIEEKEHKYSRKNIDLDHATHVKFSPDGTAILAHMAVLNTLQVYRVSKQKKTLAISDPTLDFPKETTDNVISIGIASTGKFVMTCTSTAFWVWTLKGEVLAKVETKQAPNSEAIVSPCGKFIACSGFTPDVKIWEVEYSKGGDYQQVSRVMELKGHEASVQSICYAGDSRRMASVSKDGTWKYWDTDVRYKLREDPHVLKSGGTPEQGPARVALAPDTKVVAVAINFSIFIFSTSSGDLMEHLDSVHGDTISALVWEPSSLYLVSAGGEDRYIRVWYNHAGQRELLVELRRELPRASSEALKRRIQQQIAETESRLPPDNKT